MTTDELSKLEERSRKRTGVELELVRDDDEAGDITYVVGGDGKTIGIVHDDTLETALQMINAMRDALKRAEVAERERDEPHDGYRRLDANWDWLHEKSMGAIRDALGMSDASVPEMVSALHQLQLDRDEGIARAEKAEELLRRAIKYSREDGMVTPGATRLARVLDEASRVLGVKS